MKKEHDIHAIKMICINWLADTSHEIFNGKDLDTIISAFEQM